MATKRKHDSVSVEKESDVVGYVHNVTDVTNAIASSTRYFNGTIQVEHERFLRFVSFSPEKQHVFKSAEATRSPVKLTDCLLKPRGTTHELIVRKKTEVSICKKLDFCRSTKVEMVADLMSLADIQTSNTMCSIKVKVTSISTITSIDTKYGKRLIQKVNVADSTKAMALSLWAQHTNKCEVNKFYVIENVISSMFQGELQLGTTAKSDFKPVTEFEVTQQQQNVECKTSVGTIVCCNLKGTSRCLNCKKAIDNENTSDIVKCQNCSAKQKLSKTQMTKTLTVQLHVTAEDVTTKFVVFNDVLSAFLTKYNLQCLNNDEVENHVLGLDNVVISHKANSDIAVELDVEQEEEIDDDNLLQDLHFQ